MSDITKEMYMEAKQIVSIYEAQSEHNKRIKLLNMALSDGESFEYKDGFGNWYPYCEDLQNNRHFEPLALRIGNNTM